MLQIIDEDDHVEFKDNILNVKKNCKFDDEFDWIFAQKIDLVKERDKMEKNLDDSENPNLLLMHKRKKNLPPMTPMNER